MIDSVFKSKLSGRSGFRRTDYHPLGRLAAVHPVFAQLASALERSSATVSAVCMSSLVPQGSPGALFMRLVTGEQKGPRCCVLGRPVLKIFRSAIPVAHWYIVRRL